MEKINLIIEEDNNLRLDKVIAMQLTGVITEQISKIYQSGISAG